MDGWCQPSQRRRNINEPLCGLSCCSDGAIHCVRICVQHRAPSHNPFGRSFLPTSGFLCYPHLSNRQEVGWNHSCNNYWTDLPWHSKCRQQFFASHYCLGNRERSSLRPLPAAFRWQPSRSIEKTSRGSRHAGKPCDGSHRFADSPGGLRDLCFGTFTYSDVGDCTYL